MPGTLFLVSTPIGNLEDITLRALRVLREVNLIAAEDTRRTAKLLAHYAVATPTTSFHEHNTRARLPRLLARLERGEAIALVTDAGTPGISDPGVELVRACVDRGIPVDPIPGPSAPLVAAIASGFPMEPLTIYGFAPTRAKDRIAWMQRLASVPHTLTFFEAPHRVRQTLKDAATLFGDRPIVVAREMTKVHQELVRGTALDLFGHITNPVGEFTIVIGPSQPSSPAAQQVNDQDLCVEFGRLATRLELKRRDIVADLAHKYGRSTNDVYAILERMKDGR